MLYVVVGDDVRHRLCRAVAYSEYNCTILTAHSNTQQTTWTWPIVPSIYKLTYIIYCECWPRILPVSYNFPSTKGKCPTMFTKRPICHMLARQKKNNNIFLFDVITAKDFHFLSSRQVCACVLFSFPELLKKKKMFI